MGWPSESVNDCPMSRLPTTDSSVPVRSDPCALALSPGTSPTATMANGYTRPRSTVKTSKARTAARCCPIQLGSRISNSWDELDDEQVDQLDADERGDQPAETIDQQVSTEQT